MTRSEQMQELLLLFLLVPSLFGGGVTHLPVAIVRGFLLIILYLWVRDALQKGFFTFSGKTGMGVPVLLLLLIAAISTAFISPYKNASVQWFVYMLGQAALFYMVILIMSSGERLLRVISLLAVIGFSESVLGIGQSILSDTGRIKGTFFNPNFYAGYLAAVLALLCGMAVFEKERKAVLALVVVSVLLFVAILLTGSRGGFLSLILSLTFIVWYRYRRKVVYFALGLLLLVAVIPNPLADRVRHLHDTDIYAYSRIDVWKSSLAMMRDYPLGTGLGIYKYTSPRYNFPVKDAIAHYGKFPESAHNEYLHTGVELGVVGLIAVLFAIAMFWRSAGSVFRSVSSSRERGIVVGLAGGIIGILGHSMVDMNLHELSIASLLVLFGGMLLAVGRLGGSDTVKRDLPFIPARFHHVAMALLFFFMGVFIAKPAIAYYVHDYGDRLGREGLIDDAVKAYEWAAFLDSGNTRHYEALAGKMIRQYRQTGDISQAERAINELEYARHLNPGSYQILSRKGGVYALLAARHPEREMHQALLAEAADSFEKAAALEPYLPVNHNELGVIFMEQGRFAEAVEKFRYIIEMEPNFLPARANLADAYKRMSRDDLARQEYDEILEVIESVKGRGITSPLEKMYLAVDEGQIKKEMAALSGLPESPEFPEMVEDLAQQDLDR